MKCRPFFTRYTDTWILGPAASVDTREFRIGLGLAVFEVGLCFKSEKPFGYGCNGCGAIDWAPRDQFPPGWEKRHRPDSTYYFLCPTCIERAASVGPKEFLAEIKARSLFPQKKEDFWYCGEIFDYSSELQKAGKPSKTAEMGLPCERFLINPYRDAGGKIPEEGDIVPCVKIDGWVGHYLVTKKWRYSSAGSDFAGWDDGYKINLKLHHCERAK